MKQADRIRHDKVNDLFDEFMDRAIDAYDGDKDAQR